MNKYQLVKLTMFPALINARLARLLVPIWPSMAKSVANVSGRWANWALEVIEESKNAAPK